MPTTGDFRFYVAEGHAHLPEPESFIQLEESDLDGDADGWVLDRDGITLHASPEALKAAVLVEGQGGKTQLERVMDRVHVRVLSPVLALGAFRACSDAAE
ncbi:hypothetical protein [Mycobacterium sp. SMC-17]|uniref:hypothetical protein n=1 Tax=Mycobacterium sp. SMC-17 TaxID=3381628 RepID=UPI003876CC8D